MKIDRLAERPYPVSGAGNGGADNGKFWKHTLLLATAIFLIIAPAPDSSDIAEITANFIKAADHSNPSSFKAGESRD